MQWPHRACRTAAAWLDGVTQAVERVEYMDNQKASQLTESIHKERK
jgi:hypothetical protein